MALIQPRDFRGFVGPWVTSDSSRPLEIALHDNQVDNFLNLPSASLALYHKMGLSHAEALRPSRHRYRIRMQIGRFVREHPIDNPSIEEARQVYRLPEADAWAVLCESEAHQVSMRLK